MNPKAKVLIQIPRKINAKKICKSLKETAKILYRMDMFDVTYYVYYSCKTIALWGKVRLPPKDVNSLLMTQLSSSFLISIRTLYLLICLWGHLMNLEIVYKYRWSPVKVHTYIQCFANAIYTQSQCLTGIDKRLIE